jgi:glucose 1-dehydrogenase
VATSRTHNDAHIFSLRLYIEQAKARDKIPSTIIMRILLSVILIASTLLDVVEALQLAGKRALVTGSCGGIGAAIAKRLASEGAEVMIHYNTRRDGAIATQESIVNAGGTCSGILKCDFRSPSAISKMFSLVDEIWEDGLDILINNAGIVTKLASDDDTEDLSAWHETMQVNLHAPLQISRLARRRMLKDDGGGVIVNVSSIHGEQSVEWMTAYAASKAALDSLTRGLALEYAPEVRVNAIAPGVVPVERTAAAFDNPQVVDMWLPHLPTGDLGTVEQVAEATLPLCTNEWITGTIWKVDGGMLARANMPFRPRPTPSTEEQVVEVSDDVCLEKP